MEKDWKKLDSLFRWSFRKLKEEVAKNLGFMSITQAIYETYIGTKSLRKTGLTFNNTGPAIRYILVKIGVPLQKRGSRIGIRVRNLTGLKFGKLTVIERDGRTYPVKWKCQCSCGGTKSVFSARLTNGHCKSCGCLRRGKQYQL